MLQQYVPRLTDRGLEAVEGGTSTLAPLSQIAKTSWAAYAASWGWFQGPAVVLGGWVSGLVTVFVWPSQAGASKRSLCDILLRPHPPVLSLRESVLWVVRLFRAVILRDPHLVTPTKGFGAGQSGFFDSWSDIAAIKASYSAVHQAGVRQAEVRPPVGRRAGVCRDRMGAQTSVSSWLWGVLSRDTHVLPCGGFPLFAPAGRFLPGYRCEVGLAAVRGGLTRGLTPAVSWVRAVVLRDPHVFVDTWFRPMVQYGTPSQGARTKAAWYTAPLAQPRDRSL